MDVTTVLQQLQQSGDAWDAVQDELLLRALQSLRDGILRQASDTEKQLLASSQRAEAVGLKLRAANCHLEVLAQSQFLEHRIQAEEEEVDPTPTEDLWSSCQVEPVPEVELDAIKKALSLGQSFVENQVIDEMPSLPPVIGSEAWQNSFITNVEDFLGETEPPETPAVAASPEGPEVEEEAHEDLPGSSAVDLPGEVTPSFAAPSAAPEPPNLASQLNALLTRRGGPVEGGDAEAPDPLGGALAVPPLGAAPKAKGKGKGKSKSTAKPTGSLFDEGATEVKPQAATSPGASLFDEPPVQAASPAKTGSSLFDDDAPAPLEKAGLKASPAGMGSLFDDEPLPKPKAKAKAPAANMAPATKGKGKSAPSLFDEGPQANAAPKAATKPTIAASLFDDEPAFSKPPAKAQAASSLFGEDPLFNDAPKAPKRDSSGPLKLGGGGSIFDDDATRTAPSGEGLGLLATLAPRPQRQERSSPEASPATGEPKVEAQVCPNPLFGAAATATSSPKRKSRLDSLDQDVPVPAAAPAKASGPGVAGGSLFGGSGRLAKNLFDDDDDDMVKQDGGSKVSSLFGAAAVPVPAVPAPAKAAEGDAPVGGPKAAPEPSKPGGGLFGDNEVRSNPLFGTDASAPSTRKPRLDSNDEDAPAAAPAAAAAAVPFAPPTVAAKASGGPGGPSLFGGSGRIAKDIFDDDDDDVAKQAETNLSSTLFAAAPKASVERPEGEVVSKAASAALAEPSKPAAGGLFEDNEVRSNPLFGTAASAPSTRKPRLDSNDEDAPAAAAAAAAVPFAPPVVTAKAFSGPSLFGGSGRLAKDIFDDDDDVVKQAPSGSSGLFGAVPPAAPLVKKAEPVAGARAGEAQTTAGSTGGEAPKPAAGLFGDSEVRFNPLSGSAPASSMLRKSSLDSLDGDAPAPAAAAAAPAAAPAAAATVPFAPPLVAAKAGSSGGPSLFGGSGRLATNIFDDDDDDGFVKQAAPTGSAVSSLFGAAVAAPAAAVAQAKQAAAEPLVAGDDAPKTFGEGQAVASEAPKPAAGGLFGDSEVRFNPLSASAPASSTLRKSSLDSVDGDAPAPPAPAPASATLPFAPPLVAAKAGPSGGPSLFGGSGRMATSIFDDDDDDDFVKQAAPTGSTQTGSTLSSLFGAPQAPADPLEKLAGPKTEPKPAEEKSSDPLGGKRVFKPPL